MRGFDRLTAILTLIVIPLAVYLVGSWMIDSLVTDGPTFDLYDWWLSPVGYPLVAGLLAGLVAAIRLRRVAPTLGAAAAAALLSFVYPIGAFLIFVLFGGDPGWR